MTFLTVAVITGALLYYPDTRNYGYIFLALSIVANPALTIGALVLTGIAFLFKE